MKEKPEVLLEKWQILGDKSAPYLYGEVWHHYNPDRCPDGDMVFTSTVLNSDWKTYAETQNTMYSLGKPAVARKEMH